MKFVRTALLEGVCVVTADTSGATSSTDLLRSCAEIVKARPTEGGDVNIPFDRFNLLVLHGTNSNMSVIRRARCATTWDLRTTRYPLDGFCARFSAKGAKERMQTKNAAAIAVVVLSQSFPCDTNESSK
jgi:hypothetical protein